MSPTKSFGQVLKSYAQTPGPHRQSCAGPCAPWRDKMQSTEKQNCHQCQNPSSHWFVCPLCSHSVCKNCVAFTPDGAFSYMKTVPAELSHPSYCQTCYAAVISPALKHYRETLLRAK